MTGLIETALGRMDVERITAFGNALGLDTTQLTKGIGAVTPLLACGLATTATDAAQFKSVMDLVPQDKGEQFGDFLNGLTAGELSTVDDRLLALSLGDRQNGALRYLQEKLAFDARPLIAAGAPLLLNAIRQIATEQSLDNDAVAALIGRETEAYLASDAAPTRLVKEALEAGERSAALKARFTPIEWQRIRMAPLAAAGAVMVAAKSGGSGASRELGAAVEAVLSRRDVAPAASLTTAAYATPYSDEELRSIDLKTLERERMVNSLRMAAAAVAEKAPDESRAFRDLLMSVAAQTAEAAGEGGFLGIGSVQVNDAEKAALAEIKAAIGS